MREGGEEREMGGEGGRRGRGRCVMREGEGEGEGEGDGW